MGTPFLKQNLLQLQHALMETREVHGKRDLSTTRCDENKGFLKGQELFNEEEEEREAMMGMIFRDENEKRREEY